jgi:phage terminase small subunit
MDDQAESFKPTRRNGGPAHGPARGSVKGKPAELRNSNRTPEGLTVEQEAYARARAMGMSVVEASVAVGIHRTGGAKWEKDNQKVKDRIIQLSHIATSNAILKTGLNREWVLSRLMSVVERCMQAEPVTDAKGEPTGEYRFDASGANQALRMLGDTMGMFKPPEKKDDEFATLSDSDLVRIAQELASQTGLLEGPSGDQAPAGSGQVIEVQTLRQAG